MKRKNKMAVVAFAWFCFLVKGKEVGWPMKTPRKTQISPLSSVLNLCGCQA